MTVWLVTLVVTEIVLVKITINANRFQFTKWKYGHELLYRVHFLIGGAPFKIEVSYVSLKHM